MSVSLDARSRADGGVAEGQLQALLVDERYRRRGTGMVLMSIAKQELRLRGMHIGSVLLALIWSLVQPATTSVTSSMQAYAPLLLANLDYDIIVVLTDSSTRNGC